MSMHHQEPILDSKTRRKLEDQRRMAYRRAIEDRAELRRLESEFDDIPQQIAANYLNIALAPFPRSAR
ncbi:transcriptional regulator [Pseudomonas sp. HAR-UPW-AIA-41]|uniref:PA3496 family putative envelope integrity protein n=1 Tax=Pseudomonas sp. HAR-UPW-AIA-41 TaxID=1985301 RepID=UPI000BB37210|nr:transcriptional regulator [Pseudomonas sp. HAR-UPW-AIA-41]PAV46984.1 transcriptional regulator [Pseudomonas sp. HAR-UPW-AIA-41]